MKTVKTFGFTVYSDTLDKIKLKEDRPMLLTTISPNSYGITTKDAFFRESLINSDYLVLDGVYFALAPMLLQGKNIVRNQGPDVFYHFMKRCNDQKGRVFFLGSKEEVLRKIVEKCAVDYPSLSVGTYSPPFKPEFSDEDNDKMIEAVNAFKPDLLMVGMTCPKQEKWAYQHIDKLDSGLICCIGAVFDWYAGTYKEISQIWWKLRIGWLIRAIQRPEVLSRNIPNYWIFLKDLTKVIFRLKKIS